MPCGPPLHRQSRQCGHKVAPSLGSPSQRARAVSLASRAVPVPPVWSSPRPWPRTMQCTGVRQNWVRCRKRTQICRERSQGVSPPCCGTTVHRRTPVGWRRTPFGAAGVGRHSGVTTARGRHPPKEGRHRGWCGTTGGWRRKKMRTPPPRVVPGQRVPPSLVVIAGEGGGRRSAETKTFLWALACAKASSVPRRRVAWFRRWTCLQKSSGLFPHAEGGMSVKEVMADARFLLWRAHLVRLGWRGRLSFSLVKKKRNVTVTIPEVLHRRSRHFGRCTLRTRGSWPLVFPLQAFVGCGTRRRRTSRGVRGEVKRRHPWKGLQPHFLPRRGRRKSSFSSRSQLASWFPGQIKSGYHVALGGSHRECFRPHCRWSVCCIPPLGASTQDWFLVGTSRLKCWHTVREN